MAVAGAVTIAVAIAVECLSGVVRAWEDEHGEIVKLPITSTELV